MCNQLFYWEQHLAYGTTTAVLLMQRWPRHVTTGIVLGMTKVGCLPYLHSCYSCTQYITSQYIASQAYTKECRGLYIVNWWILFCGSHFKPMDPLNVPYFHFMWVFEASNFTQVPLQPSCAHSWLKQHPLSNELAIVTALGQWSPLQSEKIASLPEMEALHGQKTIL